MCPIKKRLRTGLPRSNARCRPPKASGGVFGHNQLTPDSDEVCGANNYIMASVRELLRWFNRSLTTEHRRSNSLLKLLRSIQAETDTKRSRIETGSVEDLTGDECNPAPNSSEIELGNIRAFGQREPELKPPSGWLTVVPAGMPAIRLLYSRRRRRPYFSRSRSSNSVAAPGKIPSDGFLHETVAVQVRVCLCHQQLPAQRVRNNKIAKPQTRQEHFAKTTRVQNQIVFIRKRTNCRHRRARKTQLRGMVVFERDGTELAREREKLPALLLARRNPGRVLKGRVSVDEIAPDRGPDGA